MIKKVTTGKELREFARFPHFLYKDDPGWIPPLQGVDARDFTRRQNPALDNTDCEFYLAYSDAEQYAVCGRIAAIVHRAYNSYRKERTAFFGFFECTKDPALAAELLESVAAFAAARGMERIIGPVDFSTNYPCGVVVEGHGLPPAVMTPYSKPYYADLLKACGYQKEIDFYAYTYYQEMGIPERMTRLCTLIEKRHPEITVRLLRSHNPGRDMAALRAVYDQAFADNWGFVPMTSREFTAMERGFSTLRCYDNILLAAVDGKAAVILIALPDLNQPRHISTQTGKPMPPRSTIDRLRLSVLAVKPEFRGRGLESLLIVKLLQNAARMGIREIDCSLILENNEAMNTFIAKEFGCPLTRIFRLYGKLLTLPEIPPD